jgi:Fe-S-cluster-containing dehydrogenase component
VACHQANGLPPDTRPWGDGKYDAATDLNDRTKTIVKLYSEGERRSYVKQQCMHCVDPACVGACMLGALQKREFGIVTWDASKCVGCRYCQMACPFNVPKFEWTSRNPRIIKCEYCNKRPGKPFEPACAEVCPRQAVIAGTYTDLLEEAHRRLAEHPDRYVPKVYGENDVGGTQCLVLSHVPFEKIGYSLDDPEPAPELQQTIQHGIYQGFIAPAALYALLGAVMWRNRRVAAAGQEKGEQKEEQR